jgi:integrase
MSKAKLTKRYVENAAPGSKDIILWDTEIRGFGCKVTPKGKRSYFLYYRNESGRQRRPTIGTHGNITCEQARAIAQDWSADVRQGRDPSSERQSKRKAPTIADLCERFLREHSVVHNKEKPHYNNCRLVERFVLTAWSGRKVHEITRKDVSVLHHQLRKTPYQANRVLAMISKLMNLAEQWGYRPDGTNPTKHVEKYRESKRERYLTGEELSRLSAVLNEADTTATEEPAVTAAIRLLIATGCRMSEILTLEWSWVDIDRRRLNLPDSKTGAKTIHLNGLAIEILSGIQRIPDNPHVIVGAIAGQHLVNLQKPWRRIRKAAQLENLRIHDLRHSFASFAAGLGEGLNMIGKLLGHSQAQTTHRYAHLADDPIKAANERVGEAISGLMRREEV